MTRPVSDIIADMDTFKPPNEDWLRLDSLLDELFESGSASLGIDAMLGVFERYPTHDGFGVFWSIVHGLESLPDYESHLVESLRRAPSIFSTLMVNRLLNSGYESVDGVPLLSLLAEVARDETVRSEIRRDAQSFLDRHQA